MSSFSLSGGVEVLGFISPTDTSDEYAVIDPLYGIDGLRNVASLSELNAITSLRRRSGMVVGVNNGSQYYKLNPPPWNGTISDWSLFTPGIFTGGTVTGDTVFTNNLSATTFSASTYLNLPIDNTVTGGTYNPSNGSVTFVNNTGGTFTVTGFITGFTDIVVTGYTYSANTFTIFDSSGNTFSATINTMTGLTVNGLLSATTISASTYQNLPITTLTVNSTPISGGTSGRILFENATNTLSQSSNLFWDVSLNRLGIGTTTPTYELQTVGTIAAGITNTSAGTVRIERVGGNRGIVIQGSNGNIIGAGGSPVYEPYNYGDASSNFNIGHPSSGNYNWYVGSNSTITLNTFLMRLTRGGNLLIGTSTDAGFKLDVNGTGRFQNQLTITPPTNTTALTVSGYNVTGSSTQSLFDMTGVWDTTGNPSLIKTTLTRTNVGAISAAFLLDFNVNSSRVFSVSSWGSVTAGAYAISTYTGINPSSAGASGTETVFFHTLNAGPTSGERRIFSSAGSFTPASGNATYNNFQVNTTINQTGGASGTTRGLYVNPTLTSSFDFRAIETTVGNVMLNTVSGNTLIGSTVNTGQRLQVSGNTLINGGLTATTISATTYQNLPSDVIIINSTPIQYGFTGGILFQSSASTVSQSSNLFWDNTNGRLGIGTNIPLGILHLKETAATTRMVMDGDAGQSKIITFRTNGLQRFGFYLNNIAESGGNAGSNFAIRAYNDAGSLLSTPLYIHRNSGNIGVNTTTDAGFKLDVNGTARFVSDIRSNTGVYIGSTTTLAGIFPQGISGRESILLQSSLSRVDAGTDITITNGNGDPIVTGSTRTLVNITRGFAPTGGTGVFNVLSLQTTINQTGGSNGITRGLYVNPTLTSAFDFRAIETTVGNVMLNTVGGNTLIGTSTNSIYKLDVNGTTRLRGNTIISATTSTASGSTLTVVGSGSTQPIFTVQGSSGELFSVTDSLIGSLFSVNDISGLPILEVFSNNTVLMGTYLAPSLNTTSRVTANSGTTTVYTIPQSAYTGAFFEYTVSDGTNLRAGNIMSIWSGVTVNFTETQTTDIGSTSAIAFTMSANTSNVILQTSATTNNWIVKTIIRSI